MNLQVALLPVAAIIAAALLNLGTTTTTETRLASSAVAPTGGCDVTIGASNTSTRGFYINLEKSSVRSKQLIAGPWSTLDTKCPKNEIHVASHSSTVSTTCQLDLICDLKRQYKFYIQEKVNGRVTNSGWLYYPSESDWAAAGTKTFDLGSIGRIFR